MKKFEEKWVKIGKIEKKNTLKVENLLKMRQNVEISRRKFE